MQVSSFCWVVLPWEEAIILYGYVEKKKKFLRFSSLKIIVLFEISASGLLLRYSTNFAYFSLDILIKYILFEKKNSVVKTVVPLLNSDLGYRRKWML